MGGGRKRRERRKGEESFFIGLDCLVVLVVVVG